MHQSRWVYHCCYASWTQQVVVGVAPSYFVVAPSQVGKKPVNFTVRASNAAQCVCRVYRYTTGSVRYDLLAVTLDGTLSYGSSSSLLSSLPLALKDCVFFEVVSVGTPIPVGLTMALEVA